MRKALLIPLLSMLVCWAWGQSYSYRYWIDNNVGSAATGSGTGETQFSVNTASLDNGIHTIHVQAKNASGVWSSVQTRYFMLYTSPNQSVTSARYWLDRDLSTMHNGVATNGVIDIDISTLKVGLHSVHYQKIATDGTPSSAFTRYFMLYTSPNQSVKSARYWLDNDLSTMHNSVATSGIINIDISNLKVGLHSVHYQKIGADGTPSAARTRYFWVDREQQGGYAAAISIDDGDATLYDITGEDIVIDLGELKGDHQLHVVIYDANKRVVDEQTHTFAAAPIEDKAIELTQAGTLASYISDAEKYVLKELTITGPLNSTDFKLLRDMAGNNYLGEATEGKLQKLDLSGATIVTGGENYLNQLAIEKSNELGKQVFKGCKLQVIILPEGLLGIDERAFEGCTALTDVISYIKKPFDFDRSAFCLTQNGDFTSAKLTVPYNTKTLYQQAEGWKYFKTITEMSAADTNIDFADANVKAICVDNWDTNDDGELSYAEAAAVTSLGTAFKGTAIVTFDELKYFTGLKNISNSAFQNCRSLTSVLLPDGITAIGESAFNGCTLLPSIVIPAGVQEIGANAFGGCNSLATVTALMATPPAIDATTFSNCANTILNVNPESRVIYKKADYWKNFSKVNGIGEPEIQYVQFADANVKAICVEHWDTDDDGDLSIEEAAAVTAIGTVFQKTTITSFDELRYFTGLTSIDALAFASCKQLKSIMIPRSVTTVGGGLFSNCDALTSIKVDEENTKLDSRNNCNAIIEKTSGTLLAACKTTVIPANVTAIGDRAFYQIHGITDLVIPKSVTSIGREALGSMNALTSLAVEDGNTIYDSREGCNAIIETATNKLIAGCKTTVIPETVTSIDNYAFKGCEGLLEVTLPQSMTAIGTNAFDGCVNLTTVTSYLKQPLAIGENTFTNRTNAALYVPYGCKAVYEAADYWKEFKTITEMERVVSPNIVFADELTKAYCVYYWDTDGDNELSEEEAAAVETIGTVFQQAKITSFDELRYFTGLTSISGMAFALCQQLESIIIPRSVTTVGGGLFYYCDALTSVKVDEANPVLDSRNNCNAIIETATGTLLAGCTTTVIPDNVTAIGDLAFYHVHGLSDLTLPQGLKSIGLGGLFGMMDQVSLVIPKSVTSIGREALGNMNALKSLVVEEGNTVYDSRGGCNAVIETATNKLIAGCKTTVIPNTVTSIGGWAFDVCPIAQLHIPASVIAIDEIALRHCNNLSSITVAEDNKVYNSLGDCNAIMVSATGQLLFGCMNTVIPETARSIANYAFMGCEGLQEIALPKSITAIGTNAFDGCINLTTVVSYMQEPPVIVEKTFTNRANATLYVPYGCRAVYAAADYWKEFKPITEMERVVSPNVVFADATTKAYCVHYWDTDGDGELSEEEAAAVETIGTEFQQSKITSFDELRYFTGLTSISGMAFSLCQQLKSIVIPRSVTTVGGGLFHYCDALTSVKVDETNPVLHSPDNCNAIIEKATGKLLAGCKTTVIPDNVTAIGNRAFYHIHGVSDLTLPQGLKSIDNAGLFGMLDLTSIVVPKSVTSIGLEAFGNLNALTSLVVEDGNTVYDSRGDCNAVIETATNKLISGCMTTIIPNTVASIDMCAFDSQPITELHIPASVTAIDEFAVRLCGSLSSITVATGNSVYDSHGGCNAIIETATGKLLLGCPATVIPAGTKSIAKYAFYGYESLESIRIPRSVTAIGDNAFDRCNNLLSVTVGMKQPMPIAETTFTSRFDATLYVPIGTKALYQAAEYWKDFYDIEEIEMEDEIDPTDISTLTDAIYANTASGSKGGSATLTINLKNAQATNAYSFDLVLPNGVTVDSYSLSNRHNGHSESLNRNETTGVYSFAVLSIQSREVTGNDGTVLTLKLSVADNVSLGDYAVKIQNAKYSLTSGSAKVSLPETISILTIENYMQGDVNGDGDVDIADAVCIVNHVVGKPTPTFNVNAADVNGDGDIDIADAVRIVNLVVGKINALAPKFEFTLPEPQ